MKKKLIIIILIIFLIGLIPIKKIYSDLPFTTYNAIFYKYIKYSNNSIYDFEYKDTFIIFPLNFKSAIKYYNDQIQNIRICNNDGNYKCVELLVGKYMWNKKDNDAIFPIARTYKEILKTNNNQELSFSWSSNVDIESVIVYDVKTTNTLKEKVNITSYSLSFHDLNPGEYIISIKAISKYNKDNNIEYSFKIKIEE